MDGGQGPVQPFDPMGGSKFSVRGVKCAAFRRQFAVKPLTAGCCPTPASIETSFGKTGFGANGLGRRAPHLQRLGMLLPVGNRKVESCGGAGVSERQLLAFDN